MRQLLSPADDTASRTLVNVQTATTRVKEIITEGVSKGWGESELTSKLNAAIAAECRKIEDLGLLEQTKKALVTAARKWHYELSMTYRVLDNNLAREVQRQPLNLNIGNLLQKTPYEKLAEFRKILDDGTSPAIPVIKDYQRSVKLAMKAMSAEPPKTYAHTGKPIPIRLRAEMATRYAASVENLQQLIDSGVMFCWISSHPNCSPRCKDFQGKLYSLFQGSVVIDGKEYGESGTIDGIHYEPINNALAGPQVDGNGCISGYNCRHRAIEYTRGSVPPADFSEAEIEREYAVDKQQRAYENQIRQLKTHERLARKSGMEKEAAALRKQWRKLTVDYQIYSMEHDRAFYPYRCVIDETEEYQSAHVPKTQVSTETVDTFVNWSIINNKPYFDRLRQLGGKRTVGNTLASSVLHALQHRDGTKGEDLYLIDARSGILAYKNTSSKQKLGVEKSARMEKLLSTQDDKRYILFHNHPMSSPPSVSDLNSLYQYRDKIKFGVIVGHDGTAYKYTAPSELIKQEDVDIANRHFLNLGFSEKTAFEKAIEALSLKFGFVMEVIRDE